MAKGFKHGAGGGSSLNFKVVGGTTEPSNPKENTIWVNTDVEVTNWHFSVTQPENMSEGEVWFYTGTTSTAAFNTIKNSSIHVYPLSAKQYVSGSLVDVTAKSYQGGAWVDWIEFYYKAGNEYEGITGGWIGEAGGYGPDAGADVEPTIEKTSEYMTIKIPYVASKRSAGTLKTKNKIDLTGVSRIEFDVGGGAQYSTFQLIVYEQLPTDPAAIVEFPNAAVTRNIYELNVSALSGEYYVGISGANYATSSPVAMKVYLVEPK